MTYSIQPFYYVYGKPGCGWCTKAKALLKEKGKAFNYIDISKVPSAKEYILSEGHETVPQVYAVTPEVDQHIGGYEQLVAHLADPVG